VAASRSLAYVARQAMIRDPHRRVFVDLDHRLWRPTNQNGHFRGIGSARTCSATTLLPIPLSSLSTACLFPIGRPLTVGVDSELDRGVPELPLRMKVQGQARLLEGPQSRSREEQEEDLVSWGHTLNSTEEGCELDRAGALADASC
jgi:hypothetical protein